MIMVRRNELACRDSWSRSLWQPAGAADSDAIRPHLVQSRPPHPEPPFDPSGVPECDERRVVLPINTPGEDVLLSEARIVSEPPAGERDSSPRASSGFDPRSAIFRAREAYRERARVKAIEARHSAGAEAVSGYPEIATELNLSTFSDLEDEGTSSGYELEPGETPPLAAKPEVQHSAPLRNRPSSLATRPGEEMIVQFPEVEDVPAEPQSLAEPRSLVKQTAVEDAEDPREELLLSATPVGQGQGTQFQAPDWFSVDLPRICRACRDFRPAAEGERGWCGNTWAFTTRRLVQAQEVAPCQSAIGDWWVPVDDVWLVAADVSAHGRPTPLLDRLTAAERMQRRRS
jgi:hypothetical protein